MSTTEATNKLLVSQRQATAAVAEELEAVRRLQNADLVATLAWQQAQKAADDALMTMVTARSELTVHIVKLEQARVQLVSDTAELQTIAIRRSMNA